MASARIYVLAALVAAATSPQNGDATDEVVIDRMLTLWTNFAKTGDPSIPGDIDYPLYDAATESYVDIGAEASVNSGLGEVLSDD